MTGQFVDSWLRRWRGEQRTMIAAAMATAPKWGFT
jgi:hypothetical protein